jgi:nitrogenase molybdenum-iron protein NifN
MKIATQNACKLCTPLGASLAYKSVKDCIPLLHGSQGCATYIRRYTISHFREPIDIASSSFTEDTAIFGGQKNLFLAIDNITSQYEPRAIGIASSCLSETIGEDVSRLLDLYRKERPDAPLLFQVSTASYKGTHRDGYWNTVAAIIEGVRILPSEADDTPLVVTPGLISPADLRALQIILKKYVDFPLILGDYSETLDGGSWDDFKKIPPGGTSIETLAQVWDAALSIDFTFEWNKGGSYNLSKEGETKRYSIPMPIGVELTDRFHLLLSEHTEKKIPKDILQARSRLLDAYTDGHKYCFGKRVVLYGEPELVYSLAMFMEEIGMIPVLCATGSKDSAFKEKLLNDLRFHKDIRIEHDFDFEDLEQTLESVQPDLIVGNSKGFKMSKNLGIPLIRLGFPVHDRFGAARIRLLDYEGTMELFDRIINAILEVKQSTSPVGYSYQ